MIFSMTINNFFFTMAGILLVAGILVMIVGIVVMVSKVVGREINAIATQTSKLAQKGLSDDLSGLVGNAANLIDALNQLTRTNAGVGIFLVIVGFALIGCAYALVRNLIGS